MPLMKNEGVATKTEIIGLIAKYRAIGGEHFLAEFYEGDDVQERFDAIQSAGQELACAIANYCSDNRTRFRNCQAILHQGVVYQARGVNEIDGTPRTCMIPLKALHNLELDRPATV